MDDLGVPPFSETLNNLSLIPDGHDEGLMFRVDCEEVYMARSVAKLTAPNCSSVARQRK